MKPGIILLLTGLMTCLTLTNFAQETQPKKENWEKEGELESVEIEIVKERQITLPKANRNFEKIPPRPSEPIKPPITYDFRSFSFQAPQVSLSVKPLKLKAESKSNVYGGFIRAGYGNYASPLLEAFINSRRDKNKLVGAYAYHHSSGKGPVDGNNSGAGATGISLYGKSFSDLFALSGNISFDKRTTHFYGYPEGAILNTDTLEQSFILFKMGGEVTNSKNSDFSYTLGAAFSHMADKYDARESEVNLKFRSAYELDENSIIDLNADYALISRKDEAVEAKPRSLFTISPSYSFVVMDALKLKVGFVAAFENDTLDSKSAHVYPMANASYPLSPSVDVEAGLTGGIEKVSLQSLVTENMWLAPNVPVFHSNKSFDFTAGIRAKLGNKVFTQAGLGFSSIKNLYSYVNLPSDQSKFTTVYDEGLVKRSNIYAALSYSQSQIAKFLVRGDYYTYTAGDLNEVFHRPTYKLTINGSYNVYNKIILSADVIAQGGMKAYDATQDKVVKLKNAFDLNAKGEYIFSESFSAFLQFNNITSNKYPVLLHYPVRGLQVTAGITWSF